MKTVLSSLLIVLVILSCRTPQGVRRSEVTHHRSPDSLLSEQKKTQQDFPWITAKVSAQVETPEKSVSFQINLRIRKDSVIWASISPAFGIEIARALVRPDSVFVMSRTPNRELLETDFAYLSGIANTDIDFEIFQALITGTALDEFSPDEFKAFHDKDGYVLSRLRKRKLRKMKNIFERIERLERKERQEKIERLEDRKIDRMDEEGAVTDSSQFVAQSLWLRPEDYRIIRYRFRDYNPDRILEVNYSDFRETEGKIFPMKITIQATGQAPLTVKLEFTRVSFEEGLSFPFNVPDSYKRTRLE